MLSEILQVSKWHSLAGQISPMTGFLIGLVSLAPVFQFLVARYSASQRIKDLGSKAPSAPHWAPLGKKSQKPLM